MITTKQRAYLRSMASTLNATMQIGKDALKEESVKQIVDMLEARELVKIKVLKNCEQSARELADSIQQKIGWEVVQVIGLTIVLYKRSSRKDVKHISLNI